LDEIAREHGTDKSSVFHDYTRIYERYFEAMRERPIVVLELGWGQGKSARTWREYFPNATIVMVDNRPHHCMDDGIHLHIGDQADAALLTELHERYGDFDIVIDDASHVSSLTIRSFQILYPWLKPGGLYVVEDTHGSYHDFYYGKAEANRNPDIRRADGGPTMMQFFRRLADEVNYHGDGQWDLYPRGFHNGFFLDFVHFYFNIVFIKKAEVAGV
jgi:8-demethyl-8-(2-methoxy-alpha-L-rhamnosyl)tetracenomycin-C 3'-O-methyltransferase